MEYHVYLPALLDSADGLEEAARRQNRMLTDLEDTMHRLQRLSCMDAVLGRLRRRKDALEETLQKTLRMAQSLRRIHQTYREMENAVVDGIELPAREQQTVTATLIRAEQGALTMARAPMQESAWITAGPEGTYFRAAPVVYAEPPQPEGFTLRLSEE